jgi:hypothetical protein
MMMNYRLVSDRRELKSWFTILVENKWVFVGHDYKDYRWELLIITNNDCKWKRSQDLPLISIFLSKEHGLEILEYYSPRRLISLPSAKNVIF